MRSALRSSACSRCSAPPEQRPEDHRDEVVRRMAELADRAQAGRVVLLHQNEKEIFGDVSKRVHDIVTSVASPALRLAWDAANYVQCGVVPFPEAYELLRPYTDYIQIKDAVLETGEVVTAGEGDGRVRETMRALADDGFDGFFSIEPHLAAAHHLGGFSGPDNFIRATKAFTGDPRCRRHPLPMTGRPPEGGPVMRFALVGCGVIIAPTQVQGLQALSGRVEPASCSDVVPERADALAKVLGLEPRAFA